MIQAQRYKMAMAQDVLVRAWIVMDDFTAVLGIFNGTPAHVYWVRRPSDEQRVELRLRLA